MTKLNLPPLASNKSNRVVTKHFTNLFLYLDTDQLSLFTWLIYQSSADNLFTWDGHILDKYRASVTYAVEEYGGIGAAITPQKVRANYRFLKQKGYILATQDKELINPMFSYCISRKAKYEAFSKAWSSTSIEGLIELWIK